MSEPNDDSESDDDGRRLPGPWSLVLLLLAVFCAAYLAVPGIRVASAGFDYVGVTLGVGLMLAGTVHFLRPRLGENPPESADETGSADESESPEPTGDSGANED
ncbi:hypothetical protein [Halomicrococcus sp. NG-SE-24]|uniref:hypothetical protein n=1 Tax=Halomicrococcus sp. NG-SE-24 TaxID=3436928 RepID=UPI003D953AD8